MVEIMISWCLVALSLMILLYGKLLREFGMTFNDMCFGK
jgi:hypothetical protein